MQLAILEGWNLGICETSLSESTAQRLLTWAPMRFVRPQLTVVRSILSVLLFSTALAGGRTEGPTSFEELKALALKAAQLPYEPPEKVATHWRSLSYAQYSQIRFRTEHALWSTQGLPFSVEFMHPGYVHQHVVELESIENGLVETLPCGAGMFDYGSVQPPSEPPPGFSGFKVISRSSVPQEVAAFIGASYFRMVGLGQSYGLSARGLCLDVVGREEFPDFRRFWFVKPAISDAELALLALLDSPRVCGAFEFRILPGTNVATKVRTLLVPRAGVKDPGLAPLTSMFLHDDNGRPVFRDFRPEVHDSDGLLMHRSDDLWLWRPLEHGKMIRANMYGDQGPKGFGLLQRDRDFTHYQDPVAGYERRPSAWIVPEGSWGAGAVSLIQFPSDREFSDNVVAYWRPESGFDEGKSIEYAYTIQWTTNRILPATLAQIVSSRIGQVVVEPATGPPNLRFVVDFKAGSAQALDKHSQLQHEVAAGPGASIVAESLYFVEESQVWRLVIETTPPTRAVDLRAALHLDRKPVSEWWTFTWQP